jgi:hypothetical protein
VTVDDRGTGEIVVFGVGDDGLEGAKALAFEAGDEETPRLRHEALAYGGNLLGRLAEAEDDLRQVVTNAAVVVELGEVEVFVRQVTELRQRLLNVDGAVRDLLQEQS